MGIIYEQVATEASHPSKHSDKQLLTLRQYTSVIQKTICRYATTREG